MSGSFRLGGVEMVKYLFPLLFLGCASVQSLPNFHEVDPGLFRSGQFDSVGCQQLKAAGVKTILKLNTDSLSEEAACAGEIGAELIQVPLSGLLAPNVAAENLIQQILVDHNYRPLLVHCEHGSDRTGLAIALYRVHSDHWKPIDAHDEWMKFGHSPFLFEMDDYFEDHTK